MEKNYNEFVKYIQSLSNEYNKVDEINNWPNEMERISLLQYINKDYRMSIVKKITDDNVKLSSLQYLDYDNYKADIVCTFSNENLRIEALSFIKSDSYKSKIINTISDENVRYSLLDKIVDESAKYEIISRFTSDDLKANSVSLLTSLVYIVNIINSIKDESLRITLVKYAGYKIVDVVKAFTDDSLKYKSLELIDNESYKLDIVLSINSDTLKCDALSYFSDDNKKLKIIKTFKDDNVKLSSLKYLYDGTKVDIVHTFINEDLKIEALDFIKLDSYKSKIINTIKDENIRYSLLNKIADESAKYEIIMNFTDDNLKVNSVNLLTTSFYIVNIINSIKDESLRIPLVKYAGYKIVDVVKAFTDDSLKYKSLELIDNESHKLDIVLSINSDILKCDALSYFSDDSKKVKIISTLKTRTLLIKVLEELKSDIYRVDVIKNLDCDEIKVELLELISEDRLKIVIIDSLNNDVFKVQCLSYLSSEYYKLSVINSIDDDIIRLKNINCLEDVCNRIYVISLLKSDEIKNNAIKNIDDYEEILKNLFFDSKYDIVSKFDFSLLKDIFGDKGCIVLSEYKKLTNDKMKNLYSNYVSKNYDDLDMTNLNMIAEVLFAIDMSNSSELQAFGDLVAREVLTKDDPISYLSKVEDIFIKNNIPYVGKVFKVFKLLHSNSSRYKNYSPILNRFLSKDTKNKTIMLDLIIFNDLLKCSFGSNNRSLRNFLKEIEAGNSSISKYFDNSININEISVEERNIIYNYICKIETMFGNYNEWHKKDNLFISDNTLEEKLKILANFLNQSNINYKELPDLIIKKFCGFTGIDTFEDARKYIDRVVSYADLKNRERAKKTITLEEGDFVKGIGNVKYLSRILQNGSVSKEFLGESSNSDRTPLDTDLSRITAKDLINKNSNELGKIISSTISGGYGDVWIVLKNDPNRIEITRDSLDNEIDKSSNSEFSKLEAFKTLADDHYGIRTGFPSSEISYIVSDNHLDRIGLEIVLNGFYIPVVNKNGELVFSPDDYDMLKAKMSGLSYYNENNYHFSDNLITEEILLLASQIEKNNTETAKKRNKICSILREAIAELNLDLKTTIDGDLSNGTAELIDTGSTGRGTNKPGDGDFDFMLRVDNVIMSTEEKMVELKNVLLKKLKNHENVDVIITDSGDLRLKNVSIGDGCFVDVDITFAIKTDKLSYSTDMALQDRLNSIRISDSEKYKYVVSNILLAKQFLKQAEVYKPNRGDNPQGGLGGVGIENWILQNGGSFIDAANDFLSHAEGKSFDDFKKTYSIWDFGENHLADRRNQYPHDNFVTANMSENGYNKMVSVLREYVNNMNYEHNNAIKR